jgi:hypothetical protein
VCKKFSFLDRSNGTLSKDVRRRFLFEINFLFNFNRIEQFETLFKSDLIDLKKLKILAFNGKSKKRMNHFKNLFCFSLGCPAENGIRSLTWKVNQISININFYLKLSIDFTEISHH